MTALVAKACGVALQEFPGVNSSLDLAAGKQIFKKHYHVGIAADTPHGFVVPVLRDVDKKSVLQLAEELARLRPNLPIVLTTGFSDEAAQNCKDHGIRMLIKKPFVADGLYRAIEELLVQPS